MEHEPSQLSIARTHHCSTLLDNGSILITGGVSEESHAIDLAETLDPIAGRSTLIADRHLPREQHRCVKLADGRVALIGGAGANGRPEKRVEVFNPTKGTFSVLVDLKTARVKHEVAMLRDGRILVAGGVDDEGNALDSAEVIDSVAGTSTKLPSRMRFRRYEHAVAVLKNGLVLITVGGPAVRDGHTATLMKDGRVLIVGGGVPDFSDDLLGAPLLYNPQSNSYVDLNLYAPSVNRANHTAVLTWDGTVFVMGGRTLNSSATKDVYAYDPAARTFRSVRRNAQ
ncbi:Kelch repeat-containing protein [Cystobacter fuscus]